MKAARVKQLIIHKGSSIRSLADYVSETLEARRQWANTFKMLKEKKTVNQKSYTQQNYPSGMREKVRHSQINKS